MAFTGVAKMTVITMDEEYKGRRICKECGKSEDIWGPASEMVPEVCDRCTILIDKLGLTTFRQVISLMLDLIDGRTGQ